MTAAWRTLATAEERDAIDAALYRYLSLGNADLAAHLIAQACEHDEAWSHGYVQGMRDAEAERRRLASSQTRSRWRRIADVIRGGR